MITLGFEDPFLEPPKTYILQGQLAPSAGRQGVWKLERLQDISMRLQNKRKKGESNDDVRYGKEKK